MINLARIFSRSRRLSGVVAFTTLLAAGMSQAGTTPPVPDAQRLNELLSRTAGQTAGFLDQFSDVKCLSLIHI